MNARTSHFPKILSVFRDLVALKVWIPNFVLLESPIFGTSAGPNIWVCVPVAAVMFTYVYMQQPHQLNFRGFCLLLESCDSAGLDN